MDSDTYDKYLATLGEEDDHVEFWKHDEPGDRIMGILFGYQRGNVGRSGGTYDVAVLRDPRSNELIGIPLWRTALAGKFAELGPQEGDILVVTYLGRAETRNGAWFHNYKVILADEHGRRIWRRPEGETLAIAARGAPASRSSAGSSARDPEAEESEASR